MSMQESIQLKMKFALKYRMKEKMEEIQLMNQLNFYLLNVRPDEELDKKTLTTI